MIIFTSFVVIAKIKNFLKKIIDLFRANLYTIRDVSCQHLTLVYYWHCARRAFCALLNRPLRSVLSLLNIVELFELTNQIDPKEGKVEGCIGELLVLLLE